MLSLKLGKDYAAVLVLPDGREARVFVSRENASEKARITFDFPKDVRIVRESLRERVPAEQVRPGGGVVKR